MTGDSKFDILLVTAGGASAALDRASGVVANGAGARSALAALTPRRGATVLAVSDTVFRQTVRLAAPAAETLTEKELESALYYEIEPFCGLRRDDAAISSIRLPSGEWDVAALSLHELQRLRDDAGAAKCRLLGVAAPPKGAESTPKGILAALLADDAPPAPIISTPRQSPLSPRRLAIASASLAAIVAVGCLADWLILSSAERRLAPRLSASESANAAKGRILSEIRADENRVAELEADRIRRDTALMALAAERDAWLRLLATIAAESGRGDFALASIGAADNGGASIQCVAASADAAAGAMARLSAALSASGWALRPDGTREGGEGLAAFSFQATRGNSRGGQP